MLLLLYVCSQHDRPSKRKGEMGNSSAREREGHPRVHARPNSSFIFPLERLPRMLSFRCSLLNHCYSYK